MNRTQVFIISLIFTSFGMKILAQSKNVTYTLKKGEVLDLIFMKVNQNKEKELSNYIDEALPIAKKYSYEGLPHLEISGHSAGNLNAELLIFGKWKNIGQRTLFTNDIISHVPDFHEQRRNIWSYFGLTYYEMKEDLTFHVDKEKYLVTTAYWARPNDCLPLISNDWQQKVQEYGGSVVVELVDGLSPIGYYYQPDYLIISSWENKAAFETFEKNFDTMREEKILHINQFVHNLGS